MTIRDEDRIAVAAAPAARDVEEDRRLGLLGRRVAAAVLVAASPGHRHSLGQPAEEESGGQRQHDEADPAEEHRDRAFGSRLVDICFIAQRRPRRNWPPAATVVFLIMAMNTLPIGEIIERNACGRMISRSDRLKVSPIERAASACPIGMVLTPERSDSQTNDPV